MVGKRRGKTCAFSPRWLRGCTEYSIDANQINTREPRTPVGENRAATIPSATYNRDTRTDPRIDASFGYCNARHASLSRQPRHDARRSARGRGDAALFHRDLRQRRPARAIASAGRPRKRSTRRRESIAGGHRRQRHAKSSSPAAPPKATTWPSAASPSGSSAAGNHLVSVATEHQGGARSARATRPARFEVTLLRRRASTAATRRAGSIRRTSADAIRDDTLPGLGDAGQQRNRRHPTAGRNRRDLHERGVLLHCDATQAVGKMPVDVECTRRRPDELHGPQDLRPQRDRRAVRAARDPHRAARTADRRRRAQEGGFAAARSTCRASSASPRRWNCASTKLPSES